MAAGYYFQGSCLVAAAAPSAVCQRLYPIISWSGTAAQARSCTSVSSSGAAVTVVEASCVGLSCSAVSTSYTLQACDTYDIPASLLLIFGALVAAMAVVYAGHAVISLFRSGYGGSD